MKKLLLTAFLLIALLPWPSSIAAPFPESGDAEFTRLAEEFLDGYLAWRPQQGTALGLHRYDGKATDFRRASIAGELARLKSFEERLARLDASSLSPLLSRDRRLLEAEVKNQLFSFEYLKTYSRNPMTYAGALDTNIYLKRRFAPLEERARSVIAILHQAPAIFAAARANLEDPLPRPFIDTAIRIARGASDFLKKDLPEALTELKDPALLAGLNAAGQRAVEELGGFAAWLEKEKLPRSTSQFALGREKFRKMLLYGELIDLPPERILEVGLKELEREKRAFEAAARLIDPDRRPLEVFKEIQKDHPRAHDLIADTRKNLEAIRRFLIDRKIISMPSEVRAVVEETPRYQRATSFASMDTPGPFEARATEAYYYVTPVEENWTEKEKEEWLTAFNTYTTDVVSIHEAYPGHYTQFLHLNASKATRIEKIIGSYAFVEGWAHYTEQMMLDEGFGNSGSGPAERLRAAKYRLAQSDEALLRLCRLCVSIKMHCQGMSLEEGTRFFMENCYYEEKPAAQEAIRGTFDPGYLYYSLGKLMILKLREDFRKQEGPAFSLETFHDQMLSHGMPPLPLLREILLQNKSLAGEILPGG